MSAGASAAAASAGRPSPGRADAAAVLVVWLGSVVLTLFVDPNHQGASTGQLLFYSVYNVAIGAFVGFRLFDRFGRARPALFALLSSAALVGFTVLNEAVVEPLVFDGEPINGEGVYYGLVDSVGTAAVFLLLRLGRELARRSATTPVAAHADEAQWFYVRVAGETRRIEAADVLYMRAERDFTHVVCAGGSWFVSESLKDLLEKSARFGLVRVHKSFAVNLRRVDRLTRTEVGLGDRRVPVGRKYADALARAWRGGG